MSPDPMEAIQVAVQRRLDHLLQRRLAESRGRAPSKRPSSARHSCSGSLRPSSAVQRRPSAPCRPPPSTRPVCSQTIPWDHWTKSSSCPQGPVLHGVSDDLTGRRAPGPAAYSWDADVIKPKAPSQSIHAKLPDESDYMSRRSPGPCTYSYEADVYKQRAPEQSMHAKLPDESFYMAKRSPGPGVYDYEADAYKKKAPVQSIHSKLPDESYYMAKRSPGPCVYNGAATCAKKQSRVDSTKRRTTSATFRGPERFSGIQYELWTNGALNRYG